MDQPQLRGNYGAFMAITGGRFQQGAPQDPWDPTTPLLQLPGDPEDPTMWYATNLEPGAF
jgi:hypothetical protein